MTVENEDGYIVWWCDECDEDFAFDEDMGDFHTGWAAAKAEGWIAFHTEDGWQHRCPSCRFQR